MAKLLKLSIKTIEKKLALNLNRNIKCLGLDTASKTGYCIAQTGQKYLTLNVGAINIKSKDKYSYK